MAWLVSMVKRAMMVARNAMMPESKRTLPPSSDRNRRRRSVNDKVLLNIVLPFGRVGIGDSWIPILLPGRIHAPILVTGRALALNVDVRESIQKKLLRQ